VIAFARQWNGQTVVALSSRFFLKLRNSHPVPIGEVWGNTAILLPKKIKHCCFQDVFTGQTFTAEQREDEGALSLAQVLSRCTVALLFAENPN
jgi:maltooligosyltrehalose synthase